MLFNSFSFLIFFPSVVILYYYLPKHWRIGLLLLASCYFYMAFIPKYIIVLFFLITVDYYSAKFIEKSTGRTRKVCLLVSIGANLGMLFFFKYFNFFNANIAALASFLHWNYTASFLSVALPLGLSFHVFQSLSYVIEVYRGNFKAEKNYFIYALYVMFFPQLVAGPIERPQHLLPQFRLEHDFNASNIRKGIERMLWGFFKKLVIADQIAVIINYLFSNLPSDGPRLIIMMVLFSYQIYCDFSGYSDIAIGSALVLGYRLNENFNFPYISRSITEFWRRWHISLSSWFRDYVYIPLGGNRCTKMRVYFNLFVVFFLCGLWHGANWTFVVWGIYFGIFMILERSPLGNLIKKLPNILQHLYVVICVVLSWVFFRSQNINQAWQILLDMGHGIDKIFNYTYVRYTLFRLAPSSGNKIMVVIILSIILLEIIQYFQVKMNTLYIFDNKPRAVRYAWYYLLIFAILSFGYLGATSFIYFQF